MPQPIKGLDDIMSGAVAERFAGALKSVLTNICDVNTKAKAKRKITITLTISPDALRTAAETTLDVKTNLAPPMPVNTTIAINRDDAGNVTATEVGDQLPGQLDMGDSIGDVPNVLQFKGAK